MRIGKWILPLILVSVFVFVLSLRQLSDPDLGFHLKYGKWIVTNMAVPVYDASTYTVGHHKYIDLHWLFQVVLYGVFRFTGYAGISLFICSLSLLIYLLLLLRHRISGIPVSITIIALFATFLIIDPRIAPRPEMFTFLLLTGMILILELYIGRRKNLLYLLPGIMLLWANMHALFVLGLIVLTVYYTGKLIQERKSDKTLLTFTIISFLVCMINPYGIKAFTLPIELLTRFNPANIYNQHIQEFMPFFAQPHFVTRDYLFMILVGFVVVLTLLTIKKQKPHELILLLLFGFLAFGSIRNIPLFVLIAIPVISNQATQLSGKVRIWRKQAGHVLFFLLVLLPAVLILQLLTNNYHLTNNSFNKTGMGINREHQPDDAATFLLDNHLNGRILNSLGFGGWLSWRLPQPVFIDGRLEVMQDSIYRQVTSSWNGGLAELLHEYQPKLVVYNYLKYNSWTGQLKQMPEWRLIYLDGIAAIFAKSPYAQQIPEIVFTPMSSADIHETHNALNNWFHGFYRPANYAVISKQHQQLFWYVMQPASPDENRSQKAVAFFNSANLKYRKGNIRGAIADYDSAIAIQPAYSKAYNNRGILKASAFKDYQGAIADFDKAIKIDPHYGDAFLGRGTAFFLLRNSDAACSDWNSARSLGNPQAARLISLHCNR